MRQLHKREVTEHALQVLRELTDKAGHVHEGVGSVAQREVVSLGQDLNSVGERSLTTNGFLESSTSSSAAVNFSVE